MRTYYFYRKSDGVFTGKTISLNGDPSVNETDDIGLISNVTDWRSQRVDLATGEIIDYQPPQPSQDHEWDGQSKRWVLTPKAREELAAKKAALFRLKKIDERRIRALSEYALNPDAIDLDGKTPRQRLQELESEAEIHRKTLRGSTETETSERSG